MIDNVVAPQLSWDPDAPLTLTQQLPLTPVLNILQNGVTFEVLCQSGLLYKPSHHFKIWSSHLLIHRAEVVLGNIIKKKGWRYEILFNGVVFLFFSLISVLWAGTLSSFSYIWGLCREQERYDNEMKDSCGQSCAPLPPLPSPKMVNNRWTSSALSSTLSVLDWHLCRFVNVCVNHSLTEWLMIRMIRHD